MPNTKGEAVSNSTTRVTGLTADLCNEIFCDAFRRRVGLGKPMTVRDLAVATGIELRTLNAYHAGKSSPRFDLLLRIVAVLGADFLSEIVQPAGVGAHPIESGGMDAYKLNAQVGSMVATIGDALADGRIDETERRAMVPKVRELKTACCRFLTDHGGPRAVVQ